MSDLSDFNSSAAAGSARSSALPVFAKRPWWLWPHVLSLEAPLVAVVWAVALAKLHKVPFWPGVLPGLALAVWTIYLADRTLDSLAESAERLDIRHRFYHRFRWVMLGAVLPLCLGTLVWLALFVIPGTLVWQCMALGMLVVLYLSLYTTGRRLVWHVLLLSAASLIAIIFINAMPLPQSFKQGTSIAIAALLALLALPKVHQYVIRAMPKSAAGGLLFALGCTTWVRFLGGGGSFLGGMLETLLLTALFTCNLTGITYRELEIENPAQARQRHHPSLLVFVGLLCLLVISAASQGQLSDREVPLAWAVGGGVILLALLHHYRRLLSAEVYRVFADLAVLAPAVAIWLIKGAQAAAATAGSGAACCVGM